MIHLASFVAENALFRDIGQLFHPLFVAIADVLAYIYGVVPDYGTAIAILTVVIMALLTPLTIKSTKSMLAMQELQPEMQKLRAKYKGAENREQLNQEMMKLYREHGASPTGGCLPMFLQMPALIVLYDVIEGLAHTVTKGQTIANTGLKCVQAVCATPRYIPHSSLMYHNLVTTPGVMHSWGMNLASKPLSHHGAWYEYIPYFAFVAAAVGLQYFQMAQMTKRNRKRASQTPSQMQTMQRIMPLIFAYIYFIVPAGVVVYMIISSAIRVLTQDLIFRYGLVKAPGEERIGGEGKSAPAGPRGLLGRATAALAPPPKTDGNGSAAKEDESAAGTGQGGGARGRRPGGPAAAGGRPQGKGPSGSGGTGAPPGSGGSRGGRGGPRPGGNQPGGRSKGGPTAGGAAAGKRNGRAEDGSTDGTTSPKPHPRSKSKRARKAR